MKESLSLIIFSFILTFSCGAQDSISHSFIKSFYKCLLHNTTIQNNEVLYFTAINDGLSFKLLSQIGSTSPLMEERVKETLTCIDATQVKDKNVEIIYMNLFIQDRDWMPENYLSRTGKILSDFKKKHQLNEEILVIDSSTYPPTICNSAQSTPEKQRVLKSIKDNRLDLNRMFRQEN